MCLHVCCMSMVAYIGVMSTCSRLVRVRTVRTAERVLSALNLYLCFLKVAVGELVLGRCWSVLEVDMRRYAICIWLKQVGMNVPMYFSYA